LVTIDLIPHHADTSANSKAEFSIQQAYDRQAHMSSIAGTLELPDEEIAAPSTRAGSLRSAEGSNINDLSSLSSADDAADKAEAQAPSHGCTKAISPGRPEQCPDGTAARRNQLLERAVASPEIFDIQFQNALRAFGMTDLAPPGPVLIEAGIQSPAYAETDLSLKSYRPTELLSDTKPRWTFRNCSTVDLNQMKDAADFFSAAGSYHDAFTLYGAICFQVIVQQVPPMTSSLFRAAIDVTRTATSDSAYAYVDWLAENYLSRKCEFVLANTAEACLLHLQLGSYSRARGNLRKAEKMCHTGLAGYHKLKGYPNLSKQARCSGIDTVIMINAILVLEHQHYLAVAKAFGCELSLHDLGPGDTLVGLMYGFAINLANDDFLNTLYATSEALWDLAPTMNDLAQFESTALFCYLWTRWQAVKSRSQSSPQSPYRHFRLAHLEDQTGIPPLEALSAISALICRWIWTPDNQSTPTNRSTLPARALERCRLASRFAPNVIFPAFLQAYATSASARGSRFSTDGYGVMVSEFVRGFADLHLSIEIWEGVGEDPRSPDKSRRSSVLSSLAPTMVSTPRSSWSGYASFRSTHQRTKQITPGAGSDEPPSTSSGLSFSTESSSFKHRWSSLTSRRSSLGSEASMMHVDVEDIIMLDDA
jgi:hypothetical protein